MSEEREADDVVRRWSDVGAGDRAPLLVIDSLAGFLDEAGVGDGPIVAEPIGDGHSNVTFLIRRGDREMILRRPPRPPFPRSAHDVVREAGILDALAGTEVPVPEILAIDRGDSVLGVPFFVMDRVHGFVPAEEVASPLDDPAGRSDISFELIDKLVAIHAVDRDSVGLAGMGRPEGFLARQVDRFRDLWDRYETRSLPAMRQVGEWLAENLPESGEATIVHGDFRLGNMIYAESRPAEIRAVLDWELSTSGDPLADLGYLLALWIEADDPSLGLAEQGGLTRAPGFPTRAELRDRYESVSGRGSDGISWYMVLALWKLAVIMEGNLRRTQEGQSDDSFAGSFGSAIETLSGRALEWTADPPLG